MDPELDILVDWDDWTEKILTTSPVMRSFVRENPLMYPHLTRTLDAIEPATTGATNRVDKMATADLP